jgi:uncharacterized cupin superfamily protein
MNGEQAPMPSVRTLITGSATGNQLALLEIHRTAGRGIVRHVHEHEDEVIYVLEGELTFHIGGNRAACPGWIMPRLTEGDRA